MLYSCTHVATVGVKGLILICHSAVVEFSESSYKRDYRVTLFLVHIS